MIQKYGDYYYQVKNVVGGFGWFIYNQYGKGRELMEKYHEVVDSYQEAVQDAKDAITYYYQ